MELMSQKFQYDIEQAFKNGDGCIIATVPQKSSNLPTVEQLKKNPRCKLYTVSLCELRKYQLSYLYLFLFRLQKVIEII